MIAKKIYFHVGVHKTGTTSIQAALRDSGPELEKAGYKYLKSIDEFRQLKFCYSENPDIANRIRDYIQKECVSEKCSYIISSEECSGDPSTGYSNRSVIADSLITALEGFETKIILYLRRQDLMVESVYTQLIQQGKTFTFKEFALSLPEDAFSWENQIESFSRVFGEENIIVRIYDKSVLPKSNSLLVDFSNIFENRPQLDCKSDGNKNRGFTLGALEIARICNRTFDDEKRKKLRRFLQTHCSRKPHETFNLLSHQERLDLLQRYKPSNERVRSKWFTSHTGLFSAPESPIRENQYVAPPPRSSTRWPCR